ncbi:MAG: heme A synthase [Rhodothalassiaceae bacterium]|nr:MAG: heme A synthase [Rhodothalassiaceae bacterium]
MRYTTTIRRYRPSRQLPLSRGPAPERVGRWLLLIAVLIGLMVVVGGITRLTESGLSIVEWKPVTGVIPPLSEEAWQKEFAAYRQSPEYRLVNRGMTLDEFKRIYWWEYIHRLLGRLIGLAYLLPLIGFWARGLIPKGYRGRLVLIFLLGGVQGLIGWLMVKSGLQSEPEVSHYRLMLHLLFALFLFSFVLWTALDLLHPRHGSRQRRWRILGRVFLAVLVVQIALGALMAGLKAGYAFDTWPKMGESWIPPGLLMLEPAWRNVFDNAVMVHFLHRSTAWLVAGLALLQLVLAWTHDAPGPTKFAVLVIALLTALQFTLGVVTVTHGVPILWAVLHQAGAVLLLAATLHHLHMHRRT